MKSDESRGSQRRRNALSGEWVLVSPQRTQRPWRGEIEPVREQSLPAYDPQCYLCPGNGRAGGKRNPRYEATFTFENDFPALDRTGVVPAGDDPLLEAQAEAGSCRVVCFTPRHNLSIATMEVAAVARVVDAWSEQYTELGATPGINWVQIFENRGAAMGASNPHPHGQIWAQHSLPNEAVKESQSQQRFLEQRGTCLLCRYTELEIERDERVVYRNAAFAIVVPFWAAWPFETMLVSRRHRGDLAALSNDDKSLLADALHEIVSRYDRLFDAPFPYSMGFHQQPTDDCDHPEWHLHAHYYPPLLRSASIRKFMVGYELFAEPQRDLTPEEAALRLRNL